MLSLLLLLLTYAAGLPVVYMAVSIQVLRFDQVIGRYLLHIVTLRLYGVWYFDMCDFTCILART